MSKILPFGRSCKAYLRIYEHKAPNVNLCCDDCKRHLHKHGRYFRWVTTKSETFQIPIYRLYCPDCGKTTSLLPDFLVPWARFTTWVREAAVVRKTKGYSYRHIIESTTVPTFHFTNRTLKRWWKRYVSKAADAAMWIAAQLSSSDVGGDLLRMYPSKAAPTPHSTLYWFQQLLSHYIPAAPWRRGYWSFLNTQLPAVHLL